MFGFHVKRPQGRYILTSFTWNDSVPTESKAAASYVSVQHSCHLDNCKAVLNLVADQRPIQLGLTFRVDPPLSQTTVANSKKRNCLGPGLSPAYLLIRGRYSSRSCRRLGQSVFARQSWSAGGFAECSCRSRAKRNHMLATNGLVAEIGLSTRLMLLLGQGKSVFKM